MAWRWVAGRTTGALGIRGEERALFRRGDGGGEHRSERGDTGGLEAGDDSRDVAAGDEGGTIGRLGRLRILSGGTLGRG